MKIDIERFLQYNGEKLQQLITSYSPEIKMALLKDDRIRKVFMKKENHYPFVWLVQAFTGSDYLAIADDKMRLMIIKDERASDKLNAIMTSPSSLKKAFLNSPLIFDAIYHYSNYLATYLDHSNIGIEYISYVMDKYPDDIDHIRFLSPKDQLEFFKNERNYQDFIKLPNASILLSELHHETIEYLLITPYFASVFINYEIPTIYQIIVSKVTLPKYLQQDQRLINKILEIEDVSVYRFLMNHIDDNNHLLYENVTVLRNKQYDETFKQIELDTGLLPLFGNAMQNTDDYKQVEKELSSNFYEKTLFNRYALNKDDTRDINEYLATRNTECLFDIIIDRYFEEVPKNFLINVRQLVNYLKFIKNPLIDKDRIIIYQKLADFNTLTTEEIISLYVLLNQYKNNQELFYDDYRYIKNCAIESMNEHGITDEHINDNPTTTIDGVNVLELKGEDFNAYVHETGCFLEDLTPSNDLDYHWNPNLETTSVSLIGNNCLETFFNHKHLCFGFNAIDPRRIMHIYNSDSFTGHQFSTNRIYQIMENNELQKNTYPYNEILVMQKGNENKNRLDDNESTIYPTYIICFDNITPAEICLAKKLHLPILKINTSYYEINSNRYVNAFEENNYEISASNMTTKNYF